MKLNQVSLIFFSAPHLKICPQNSPNLADCVRDAIESLRSEIAAGTIKNFVDFEEKLNPFDIGNVTINKNLFYIHFQNMTNFGMQNFSIEKLRLSLDDFKVMDFLH